MLMRDYDNAKAIVLHECLYVNYLWCDICQLILSRKYFIEIFNQTPIYGGCFRLKYYDISIDRCGINMTNGCIQF